MFGAGIRPTRVFRNKLPLNVDPSLICVTSDVAEKAVPHRADSLLRMGKRKEEMTMIVSAQWLPAAIGDVIDSRINTSLYLLLLPYRSGAE